MTLKKIDIVLINQDNLIKTGYLRTQIQRERYSGRFIIGNIIQKGLLHYYKQSLIESNIYTKEQLVDKEVYILYSLDFPGGSISTATIDDDLIKVGEGQNTYEKVNKKDKQIINKILIAYIIFHGQFDLEADGRNLEYKISNDTQLTKKELKRLLSVIVEVNSLSCNDPLYDRYMDQDTLQWLDDNGYFSITGYIENLLSK